MKLPKLSRSRSGSAPPSPVTSPRVDSPSTPAAAPKRLTRGKSGQAGVPLPPTPSRAQSSVATDASAQPRAVPPGIASPTALTRKIGGSSGQIPPKVLQEIKHVFNRFDSNGDGKISAEELGAVLRCLGDTITEEEAEQMVREVDSDGDGFIDLPEFIDLNTRGLRLTGEIANLDELTAAFEIFDVDKDGQITAEELHSVLSNLGDEQCTVEDCKRMIKGVDRKGSGQVDFDDFEIMMKNAS